MIIYKVTNKINGKIYIGQTTRSLNQRMAEHLCNDRTSYFDRSLRKYGIENFDIEIILEVDTKEELDNAEKYFIKFFNSKVPNGYNLTDGGEGQFGVSRYGKDNPHYGKKHTDETKRILSENRKNYIKEKHPRARKIINLDTGEVFDCMLFACEKYNVDKSSLTKACKGLRKRVGGYRWSYE